MTTTTTLTLSRRVVTTQTCELTFDEFCSLETMKGGTDSYKQQVWDGLVENSYDDLIEFEDEEEEDDVDFKELKHDLLYDIQKVKQRIEKKRIDLLKQQEEALKKAEKMVNDDGDVYVRIEGGKIARWCPACEKLAKTCGC